MRIRRILLACLLTLAVASIFTPATSARENSLEPCIDTTWGCIALPDQCYNGATLPLWDWLVDNCSEEARYDLKTTLLTLREMLGWLGCDIIGGPACI